MAEGVMRPTSAWRVGLLCGIAAVLLYGCTLAPAVLWGDSAKYALLVHDRDLSSAQGKHAYHVMDGMAWNDGWEWAAKATGCSVLRDTALAVRMHALSAVLAGVSLGLLAATILRMTGSMAATLAGTGALAVSHIFWSMSVVTETYTHYTYNAGIILLAMEAWDRTGHRGWFLLGALFTGLCAGVNNLPGLLVPWLVVFIALRSHGRSRIGLVAMAVIVVLAGFSYRGWLFLEDMRRLQLDQHLDEGQAFTATWHQFTDASYHKYFFWKQGMQVPMLKGLAKFPLLLVYQFFVMAPLGVWGAWRMLKERPALGWSLAGMLGTIVLFTSSYMEQRRFFVMIAVYQIFAVWIGYGAWAIQCGLVKRGAWWRAEVLGYALVAAAILVPPAIYAIVPTVVEKTGVRLFSSRVIPGRDNTRFFLVPWKCGETGARQFAHEALAMAGPDGVLIADFTMLTTLEYAQRIDGLYSGVTLVAPVPGRLPGDVKERWRGRRIYLADISERAAYDIDALAPDFEFRPAGPIFELVPK